MTLKPGASLVGVHWRMFAASILIEPIFKSYGVDLVITSGTDGEHDPDGLHPDGKALDYRTRDLKTLPRMKAVEKKVRDKLGPGYDVVLEHNPPHLHAEWHPKPGEVIP